MQRVRVVSRDATATGCTCTPDRSMTPTVAGTVLIGSLRVIDEEVAAETAAEQARVQQARADALWRSVESAAIGMCLGSAPEGPCWSQRGTVRKFSALTPETLLQKAWMELGPPGIPPGRSAERRRPGGGPSDFYRMVKRYVHSDGHKLWGRSVGGLHPPLTAASKSSSNRSLTSPPVAAEQQLERQARVDTPTGPANRGEVIARIRTGDRRLTVPFKCCSATLTASAGINDKLATPPATRCSALVFRIRHCVRDNTNVGGDEILVPMPGMPRIDQVTRVKLDIRHAADPACSWPVSSWSPSASGLSSQHPTNHSRRPGPRRFPPCTPPRPAEMPLEPFLATSRSVRIIT